MKRRTFIKLSAVLAASGVLAACSEDAASSTVTTTTDSADTSTDSTEVVETEALAADVQAIVDRGVLQVGVKNAVIGFGYEDPLTNEYTGMEIDLANIIAEKLGVEIEYTAVTPATRTELLDSRDLDCVLATFTVTDERKESWDFTTAYYVDHVTVLVEDASGITNLEGLVGATIGVSSGSTSARSVVEAMIEAGVLTGDGYDSETFDASTWTDGVSFRQFEDYPSISTALSAGEVDAFSVDKSILAVYCTTGRSYIDEEFAPQDYGIATFKDSGMSAYCEAIVQECFADGTIDGLIATYNLG